MTRTEAIEILDKRGIKHDHKGALPPLGGANRARVRTALNHLHNNPAPKARKSPKKAKK